jgi:hypothetical protein|tara:strand:- start:37 stop:1332 length:1296 start_codon:yes stop_codon:yes gene_type:complete
MKVTIPYAPRDIQQEIHENFSKYRWAVITLHRRCGKSVLCINELIKRALTNTMWNPRYAYIGPTYKQTKAIIFDYLKHYAGVIPGAKFNEQELSCTLPNGAKITLLGSENPDSLRGSYFDGIIVDEYAQVNPRLFPEIIRPALSDRKGFCYLVGTPQGMSNDFYAKYQHGLKSDDWYVKVAKASETGIVDQEELDAALSVMGKNKFRQEFECDWVAAIEGAIYGDAIEKMEGRKQVTRVPYDPTFKVNTAWDIGVSDKTAIIFFQQIGRTVQVIDYYENSNEGLPHYIQVLQNKDYLYDKHYGPHDLEQREFTNNKSRREIAYELGIRFNIVPKLSIEDGIHYTQLLLNRCWIDMESCKKLLEALRNYHRKFNDTLQTFSNKPVHDWSSHACDAMRVLAVGLEEVDDGKKSPQRTAMNYYNPLGVQSEQII